VATLTAAVPDRSLPSAAIPRSARLLPPPRPVGITELHATSCAELAAACVGWDVRYVQLGSGRCRAWHVGVSTARLHLAFEDWTIGMLKSGRGPRGFVTFLVPISGIARIQGRPAAGGEVLLLLDGDEFDFRTSGPAQLVSVSLERTTLEAHLHDLFGRRLGELQLQGCLKKLRTDPEGLRGLCLDLAGGAATEPRSLRDRASMKDMETALVKALFSTFDAPREPVSPCCGRRLALRAEAWLRQNLAEPPTIATLCAALGTSERWLYEAFREHLDTSPKAYLKTLRLNAARHDLLDGLGRRVTDVALDWGFLHFGWFSQDYRRLFGETPSQTQRRGRAEPGGMLASAGPRANRERPDGSGLAGPRLPLTRSGGH
jgi:AraC family transcriptional regulator, ethanolamine operon transcriptional activator